jgi:signal transduction histidine kinase
MPLRLLIVDDDDIDRSLVRRALRSTDLEFELLEAKSAEGGMRLARGAVFECILLDYLLPDHTGAEILHALRDEGIDTPIVMLTGHGDEDLAVELMKAGASDYIPKGAMSPARLAQSIRQAVRLHRVEDEARRSDRAHAAQLRALADAAIELNAALSADAVSDRVAERAQSLMMAEAAVARVVMPQGVRHRAAGVLLADESTIPAGPMRAEGSALNAIPELARLVTLGLPAPSRSWLAAPLVGRNGARIGLLHVCDKKTGAFDENDEAILVQLAQMASVAIENAWLYASARDAAKARDDMIAVVSHDLRNPLNTIVLSASIMAIASSPERPADMVQRIQRAATRMNDLVNDLLDLTKIDAGTLTIEPRPEVLAGVVEEALDHVRAVAIDKKIALACVVAKDLPPVSIDRHRLLQAFSNLLGNAVKFTGGGGAVRIDAAHAEGAAMVRICDTGSGIAPEHLPHLFDRHWQARATSSQGAGLGLFIAKGIVEAHGGTITVHSTLGVGTTFSFTLPWADEDRREMG